MNTSDMHESHPVVIIPDVSILMRSPSAFLVGILPTDVVEIKLADVLKLHGYCAGGVAFAFRAAQEAFHILYGDEIPVRQSMSVQTSYHCCQAGALAYITGARSDFGAERSTGDLVLIPKEDQKMVFTDKPTGRAVTLRPHFDPHDIFKPLFRGVAEDHSMIPEVRSTLQQAVDSYINDPAETLFTVVMG
ncbi:MAG: FmdE family protein [Coriobacteriia bacterium]|nr:FmdE family protein [Coriobacteriia bacterium]